MPYHAAIVALRVGPMEEDQLVFKDLVTVAQENSINQPAGKNKIPTERSNVLLTIQHVSMRSLIASLADLTP